MHEQKSFYIHYAEKSHKMSEKNRIYASAIKYTEPIKMRETNYCLYPTET